MTKQKYEIFKIADLEVTAKDFLTNSVLCKILENHRNKLEEMRQKN